MLEIKNTGTGMKNAFDGFISRLNTAEKRISELQDLSIESWKPNSKENKDWKENPENPSLCYLYKVCNTWIEY